jgi:hypothetical protein
MRGTVLTVITAAALCAAAQCPEAVLAALQHAAEITTA